jgi:hypothetical protein
LMIGSRDVPFVNVGSAGKKSPSIVARARTPTRE